MGFLSAWRPYPPYQYLPFSTPCLPACLVNGTEGPGLEWVLGTQVELGLAARLRDPGTYLSPSLQMDCGLVKMSRRESEFH